MTHITKKKVPGHLACILVLQNLNSVYGLNDVKLEQAKQIILLQSYSDFHG